MTARASVVCTLLRSLPSACDQRFQAKFTAVRRGFRWTLTTPISFSQFDGRSRSDGGASLQAERFPAAQHTGSTVMHGHTTNSNSWPRHGVVKVEGRSTEVFTMLSTAGDAHSTACLWRLLAAHVVGTSTKGLTTAAMDQLVYSRPRQ